MGKEPGGIPAAPKRARKKHGASKHRLRFRILERDRFRCHWCGTPARETKLVIDHIYPFSKGGTDDPSNYVASCEPCNGGKGDLILEPQDDIGAPQQTNVERWLDLERERRTLEARLKSIVSTQDHLRQAVLERWSIEGVNSEKVDGYTVHLQRKVYPKVPDKTRLTMAVLKEGMTDLLTVDEKVLAVWVSAHEEEGTPLPPSISAALAENFERHALAVKLK